MESASRSQIVDKKDGRQEHIVFVFFTILGVLGTYESDCTNNSSWQAQELFHESSYTDDRSIRTRTTT